jgi:hypothetical protein
MLIETCRSRHNSMRSRPILASLIILVSMMESFEAQSGRLESSLPASPATEWALTTRIVPRTPSIRRDSIRGSRRAGVGTPALLLASLVARAGCNVCTTQFTEPRNPW